jgi:RimJ/RimL family protein N-acetyltransferase
MLVFFGGADAAGDTLKVLSAIDLLDSNDIAVDVVIGEANPHRVEIEDSCRARSNVTLHRQVPDMAVHMAAADLFVGAGGTSSWERCSLGLPAIVMATADNQIAQSVGLGRAGAQIYLGPAPLVSLERLAQLIDQVMDLPELLCHMAEQGQAMVDANGADRVANYVLTSVLQLRRARPDDSAAIYAWRNHPDTRRYAFDSAEIEPKAHEQWFAAVLADSDRVLLIAVHDGQPIGVLRYDINAGGAVVSIYRVPGLAGQGWGIRMLLAGETWLRDECPDVQICEAEIASGNAASLAVFRAAGFFPHRGIFRKDIHGSR